MAATAPIAEPDFDPLVEFVGMWNTRLAERYLPADEPFPIQFAPEDLLY